MSFLGNLLWIIFGGLISAISWFIAGILWSITIIGIPIGIQCFKIAGLMLCPFGKDVVYSDNIGSILLNILWLIFSGIALAAEHIIIGLTLCITIIGIPFGLQHFKLAKLAFMPFGTEIYKN